MEGPDPTRRSSSLGATLGAVLGTFVGTFLGTLLGALLGLLALVAAAAVPLVTLAVTPAPLPAQERPAPEGARAPAPVGERTLEEVLRPGGDDEPVRVMVLGTYHFHNPGLDVVQTEVPDIRSPEAQAQVARVVEGLAGFRPTRIAVEREPAAAAVLDSVYGAYLAGAHELGPSETEQLGFRLARRFGHERVHPFDHRMGLPFDRLMAHASERQPDLAAWFGQVTQAVAGEFNRRHREWTVGRILRQMNDPEELRLAHGLYLELARIGNDGAGVGADLLAAWYERNIRMFGNLQRIARPGDRLLVIVGQGHAPILRELVISDPRMELEEPAAYLPAS